MYYPKSQIKTDLYTNGKEFVTSKDGVAYEGYYFSTSNNEYFTGRNPNDKPNYPLLINQNPPPNPLSETNILVPKTDSYYNYPLGYIIASPGLVNNSDTPPSLPTQTIVLPTKEEYEITEYERYFLKKINEINYIEISQKEYKRYVNQDINVSYQLYTPFRIPWVISGNRNQVFQINKNTVSRISNNLKLIGFNSYFKGKYDQYFKYNINEGLYTDGNEFINSFTKKPYIGFYHIHPEKGPMVGAQHIEGPHAYLYSIKKYYKQKVTGSLIITSSMDEVFEYGGYNFKTSKSLPTPPQPNLSFITTWKTISNNETITIGLDSSKTYNFTVDWGDGSKETITNNSDLSHTYSDQGEYKVTIDGTFPRIMMGNTSATRDKLISINNWGNIKWESMQEAFRDCVNLHRCPINDVPDVSLTTNMNGMFSNAGSNAPSLLIDNISNWDVSTIDIMGKMFSKSNISSYNISQWDVSGVKNMSGMFAFTPFNGSLANWETLALKFMGSMFRSAESFNQSVNHFDISGVENLNFVFQHAHIFNQPLNDWDTRNVTNMQAMFNNAKMFNQPLNNWDVSNVTNMTGMFQCDALGQFDQDLSSWNIIKVSTFRFFLRNQKLSTENYKNLLIKWEQTLQNVYPNGAGYPYLAAGVDANFGESEYPPSALSARTSLSTNYNWTIIDGGAA